MVFMNSDMVVALLCLITSRSTFIAAMGVDMLGLSFLTCCKRFGRSSSEAGDSSINDGSVKEMVGSDIKCGFSSTQPTSKAFMASAY